MSPYTQILRKYESNLRDAIYHRDRGKGNSIDEALELTERKDWYFIATTLDVIGDTNLAIQHFLETGLNGLDENTDVGEKYLRLYGLLNSTYLQQEAIVVLYQKIFHWDKQKSKKLFRKSIIRKIRNKVASHSSDYYSGGVKESYVVIRNTLSKYTFEFMNNETSVREWVDLRECLEEHYYRIIDLLDRIYEKSIKTLYKGEKDKQEEQNKILLDLRKLKEEIIPN